MTRAVRRGADRPRASWCGCSPTRPRTSASARRRRRRDRSPSRPTASGGCELARGHRRRRHHPARRRADPRHAAPRCSASTSATSASSPRPRATTSRRRSTRSSHRRYTVEERLTLDVRVFRDGELVEPAPGRSTRRASRRPPASGCSRWSSRSTAGRCRGGAATASCCATPTGSTAYNFSAGGPVVWPEVEALLMVPISAHALFARPLVVAPDLGARGRGARRGPTAPACSGATAAARSTCRPGARIEVRRGRSPVRLVRLHEAPFTDRLVAKFDLPVEGWRGADRRRGRRRRRLEDTMLEEIRISSLGRDRGVGPRARRRG